jgi:hypothetical protein
MVPKQYAPLLLLFLLHKTLQGRVQVHMSELCHDSCRSQHLTSDKEACVLTVQPISGQRCREGTHQQASSNRSAYTIFSIDLHSLTCPSAPIPAVPTPSPQPPPPFPPPPSTPSSPSGPSCSLTSPHAPGLPLLQVQQADGRHAVLTQR